MNRKLWVRKCTHPEICGAGIWHTSGPTPGNLTKFRSFSDALAHVVGRVNALALPEVTA